MRLVLIGPVFPYRGGIAHYTTMLHRALCTRGHEVFLVSFKRQYPRWLFPGRGDKDPSGKPLVAKDARYWIDSLNPITWLMTFGRIRRYQPDAVILQWWTTFWAPVWLVLGSLIRLFLPESQVLYICHNVLPHETRWWDPPLARLVLRLGNRFIVQASEEKTRLLALIPDAEIAVVPLPIFDMFARERIPKEEARDKLGLPLEASVLLFFGIVRQYKGLRDILMTLPHIQTQLDKVILVVAGEFWEDKQPYMDMIERLGIADSVLIEDRYIPNERVPLYFSAADALVAPYQRATGSGAVQMGRGFKVPVVTTAVGGMREIVDDESVTLVAPGDIDALANAITQLLVDRPGPAMMGEVDEPQDTNSWMRLVDVIEAVGNRVGREEKP